LAIRAEAVIGKALDVPSQAAARRLGTLIKKIGDAIICAFLAANDAASTTVDMQRSLQQAVRSAAKSPSGGECPHRFSQSSSASRPRSCRRTDRPDLLPRQHPKGIKQPRELFEVIWERDDLTQVQNPSQTRRGDIRLIAGLREATLELRPGIAAHGTRRRKRIRHRRSPLFARIEYRHDRSLLIDHGLNTYLCHREWPRSRCNGWRCA
jgi:hypothetical protein